MRSKRTLFVVQAAIIAAIYTALTLALAPFSYGLMQIRVSEMLTVLPALIPAAIPGLFVGCILSNMLGGFGIADVIFGSSATLLAALGSYMLRKKPILVPLPPVIANGIIIGAMLVYVYQVPTPPTTNPSLLIAGLWVGAGELIACYILGYPLLKYLTKNEQILRLKG